MDNLRINSEIKNKQVRIVDNPNSGIYDIKDALELAKSLELDLVEVNPNVYPSICKLLDYQKYQYIQKRKAKENKSKQIITKEIRLSYNIGSNDLSTKENQAIKFIKEGDRVLLSMFFKGRTIMHADLGKEKIDTFINDLSEYAEIDRKLILDGKKITVILKPKNNKNGKSKLD